MLEQLSVEALVQLQAVQDLLSQLHGVFIAMYSKDGKEVTLPSRLPAPCVSALARGTCWPNRGNSLRQDRYCPEGRWCRWVPLRYGPSNGSHHPGETAQGWLVCGSSAPCPPTVLALVEAVFALAFATGGTAGGRTQSGIPGWMDEQNAGVERLGESGEEPGKAHVPNPWGLTEREAEVLRLLGMGWSNREISRRLYVSESTVKTHVAHILRKCRVQNRAQAAALALRVCLGEPGGRLP